MYKALTKLAAVSYSGNTQMTTPSYLDHSGSYWNNLLLAGNLSAASARKDRESARLNREESMGANAYLSPFARNGKLPSSSYKAPTSTAAATQAPAMPDTNRRFARYITDMNAAHGTSATAQNYLQSASGWNSAQAAPQASRFKSIFGRAPKLPSSTGNSTGSYKTASAVERSFERNLTKIASGGYSSSTPTKSTWGGSGYRAPVVRAPITAAPAAPKASFSSQPSLVDYDRYTGTPGGNTPELGTLSLGLPTGNDGGRSRNPGGKPSTSTAGGSTTPVAGSGTKTRPPTRDERARKLFGLTDAPDAKNITTAFRNGERYLVYTDGGKRVYRSLSSSDEYTPGAGTKKKYTIGNRVADIDSIRPKYTGQTARAAEAERSAWAKRLLNSGVEEQANTSRWLSDHYRRRHMTPGGSDYNAYRRAKELSASDASVEQAAQDAQDAAEKRKAAAERAAKGWQNGITYGTTGYPSF